MGRDLGVRIWSSAPPGSGGRYGVRGRRDGGRRGGRDGGRDGGRGRRDGGSRGGRTGNDRSRGTKVPGTTTIFLGNCPDSITDEKVNDIFEDCGKIKEIRWIKKFGQFRGCGFVEFEETGATDKAVEKVVTIDGRQVRVDFANPK